MKNCRLSIVDCRLLSGLKRAHHSAYSIGNRKSEIENAFTLLELLVVIAIMGILAALAVPAIKNLGRSNVSVSASRQLLDDIGRARQLAMSRRATVYMVFVPTNFWLQPLANSATWTNTLGNAGFAAAANLIDKQLTGYAFVAHGAVGDQPGRHDWTYIGAWHALPQGTFIQAQKFSVSNNIVDPIANISYPIARFNYLTNVVPFPLATNVPGVTLPYIAFNYLGQLTVDGVNLADRHEYIPLAQGSVSYPLDVNTKTPIFPVSGAGVSPGDITENPAGNSTGISYNIIDIDPLTGRASLQFHKMP